MQKGVLTAIVVVFVICSCAIFHPAEDTQSFPTTNETSFNLANSNTHFKIHKPGEHFTAEESLVWSPNNLSALSTMQFTIVLENNIAPASIDEINITGFWISESQQLFEQFNQRFSQFETNQINGTDTIVINYTYPGNIWGGDYSIVVEVFLSSGNVIQLERSDIRFKINDYFFGKPDQSTVSYACSCDAKVVDLVLKNTGEDETEFIYSINIDENFENTQLEWLESDEDQTVGSLLAGDEVSLQLQVLISRDASPRDGLLRIPILLEISYENDEGEEVVLSDQNFNLNFMPLQEEEYPEVSLSFDGFENSLNYVNSQLIKFEDSIITEVFTLGRDYLVFNLSVTNGGYYDRIMSINPTNNAFGYRIISDSGNLSIEEFKDSERSVSSLGTVDLQVIVLNLGSYQSATIELSINFKQSLSSIVSFEILEIPNVEHSVMPNEKTKQDSFQLQIETVHYIDINLDEYENYLFFNNQWLLTCTYNIDVTVSLIPFNSMCQTPIAIDYANDSAKLTGIGIQISADDSYTEDSIVVELSLTPNIDDWRYSAVHNFTLGLIIEFDNSENNPNNNSQNNSGNDNDSSNNSGGVDNPIDDDNLTDNDLDNDGIIDSLDNCPNTAVGDIVDDLGCKKVEQYDVSEQQDDGDEPIDAENKSENMLDGNNSLYLIFGIIVALLIGGLVKIKSRNKPKSSGLTPSKTIEPIMPLPALPLPSLEPVVIQQWTDGNGYSWRLMSDQSIMWWNGTDWIPYGKK